MSVEFNCVHCAQRIVDDRPGERIDCPSCQGRVKVPLPIGGELTGRRLRGAQAEEYAVAGHARLDENERKQTSDGPTRADLLPEPNRGMVSRISIAKLVRKDERPAIRKLSKLVIQDIEDHFNAHPADFQNGTFIFRVDRVEIRADSFDISARLFGRLNGEDFYGTFKRAADYRRNKSILANVATGLAGAMISPEAVMRFRSQISVALCARLDEVAGRKVPLLQRMGRAFRKLGPS